MPKMKTNKIIFYRCGILDGTKYHPLKKKSKENNTFVIWQVAENNAE